MADLPTPPPPSSPTSLHSLTDSVLLNILGRLPAKNWAIAACVNKEINRVANTVLSRPKIISAISFEEDAEVATNEVLEKALSQPIRPHFALVAVDAKTKVNTVNFVSEIISNALGSKIPLIVFTACGSSGKEVHTDEVRETPYLPEGGDIRCGINLMIGSLPGIKINAIPLLELKAKKSKVHLKRFINDVMDFSDKSPIGIVFVASCRDDRLEEVVHTLDNDLPLDTFLVGGKVIKFSYQSKDARIPPALTACGVGLLFAKEDTPGSTNIGFHIGVSSGMEPYRSKLRPVKMNEVLTEGDCHTSLKCHKDGQEFNVGDFFRGMNGHQALTDIYAGFEKTRSETTKAWKQKRSTHMVFYHVDLGRVHGASFEVEGCGIQGSELFKFYLHSNRVEGGLIGKVSHRMHTLLEDKNWKSMKSEVIGGLIFSPRISGAITYCSPIVNNVPTVPFLGAGCGGQIVRLGSSKLANAADGEGGIKDNTCLLPRGAAYIDFLFSFGGSSPLICG